MTRARRTALVPVNPRKQRSRRQAAESADGPTAQLTGNPGTKWGQHSDRDDNPYRLDVVAESGADVVRHAGGLICDRSLAGWAVVVTTIEPCTPQERLALRIVGGRHLLTDVALSPPNRFEQHEIIVAAPLADSKILEQLRDTRLLVPRDVLVWSDTSANSRRDGQVRVPSSCAARMFKQHALRSLGQEQSAQEQDEEFEHLILPSELASAGPRGAQFSLKERRV